jgi:hypothetical protein
VEGATFYFANEGIEAALGQAKDAAGGQDVAIAAARRSQASTSARG